VLAVAVGSAGGCGVELAMIGAAASAASSGSAVFKRGKLNASWMGPFDHIVAAGEVAGSELGLLIRSTHGDPVKGTWKTVMNTADGDKITIRTSRKTHNLTEFQIDVGLSGSESTARLLLKRMAVAINLDARQDGSGEVVPVIPAPTQEPEEPGEETEPAPAPPRPQPLSGDKL
ncbi:MAG: DUF3568 family protein, partial [Planctomycetota bacterium]